MVSLKEILKSELSEEEVKLIPRSFDIVGSKEKAVAIIEIPEELKEKEELIAKAIMQLDKNVKSVLKKTSEIKGEMRLREYELIAGESDTEVVHIEYACLLKLDPQKVYFSSREGTERQRIASEVKENENILVMFSGVSPYAIIIAKRQPNVNKIYGIEINELAHKYATENVRINKLGHKIILICGDVREESKKLKEKFDRIVMPLPLGAENFLDVAITCLKENGTIHFYSWGKEPDVYSNALNLIKKNIKKLDKRFKILEKRKVLPFSPNKWKIMLSINIQNK